MQMLSDCHNIIYVCQPHKSVQYVPYNFGVRIRQNYRYVQDRLMGLTYVYIGISSAHIPGSRGRKERVEIRRERNSQT
jgi:hypothetical protein